MIQSFMPSPYIGSIHFAIPLVGSANETRPSFLNDCRRFWLLEALPPEVKVLYRRIGVEWESVLHSNLMLGMLGAGRRKNQGTNGFFVPQNGQLQKMANGWHPGVGPKDRVYSKMMK